MISLLVCIGEGHFIESISKKNLSKSTHLFGICIKKWRHYLIWTTFCLSVFFLSYSICLFVNLHCLSVMFFCHIFCLSLLSSICLLVNLQCLSVIFSVTVFLSYFLSVLYSILILFLLSCLFVCFTTRMSIYYFTRERVRPLKPYDQINKNRRTE